MIGIIKMIADGKRKELHAGSKNINKFTQQDPSKKLSAHGGMACSAVVQSALVVTVKHVVC